ncbi:uncharacterized protein LAJ45_02128 [Morchella importuna]|uniref:uncharacterized protein n=1 Tax=Morchella importuna TaxID=1174673 RepID=UPI001E8CBDA1|nr:uncharacterized protein LAJ45_02128 [Morchella importuna]KAH8154360.1 hypothetical protein LAJ45_02128 [Morchella importuna]
MAPSSRLHITLNKSPDKTIQTHTYNHRVDLVLPTDLYTLISAGLGPALAQPLRCWRFRAPLSALLETGFLNKYIKSGDVIMLSQGRVDADNIYTLTSGILRLSLRHETYETAGLVGKPARFGNTAGSKRPRRYLVEHNLRDPSMSPGKKNFDRLVWSFSNVLKDPVTWLFCDLNQAKMPETVSCPVLSALSALPRDMQMPVVVATTDVLVPGLVAPEGSRIAGGGKSEKAEFHREMWREWALGVYEWLAMVQLGATGAADRVRVRDTVDPLLSTYEVEDGVAGSVMRLTWRGMVPATWIGRLWRAVNASMDGKDGWAAITVHGFENSPISWGANAHGSLNGGENGYTILRLPREGAAGEKSGRCIIYEVLGSQDEYS